MELDRERHGAPPRRGWRRFWIGVLAAALLALPAGWFGGRHLWASHHLRRAEQALSRYDFPEALEHLERCLGVWPDSVPTRLLAARTARRADLLARAEEHLATCEQGGVTPETALERFLLRAQQGDLAEVDLPLQQLAREGHPEGLLIVEALAQGYVKTNRVAPALGALADLLERAPAHPWAYSWRGRIRELTSRWSDALNDHRRAVELAPHRPAFRLRLAETLVRRSLAAEAVPHFEELLRVSPGDPAALLGMARCQRTLLKPRQAVELLDRVLRDDPDNAEAWLERGRACEDGKDPAESLRCFRRAAALNPTSYQIVFALFTALHGQGETGEARVWGERLGRLVRDEQRMKQIQSLLAKEPRNADLRYELGQIHLRFRLEQEAVLTFHEAVRDDPGHRPSHRALAEYYEKAGNAAAAAYHRQRAGGP